MCNVAIMDCSLKIDRIYKYLVSATDGEKVKNVKASNGMGES